MAFSKATDRSIGTMPIGQRHERARAVEACLLTGSILLAPACSTRGTRPEASAPIPPPATTVVAEPEDLESYAVHSALLRSLQTEEDLRLVVRETTECRGTSFPAGIYQDWAAVEAALAEDASASVGDDVLAAYLRACESQKTLDRNRLEVQQLIVVPPEELAELAREHRLYEAFGDHFRIVTLSPAAFLENRSRAITFVSVSQEEDGVTHAYVLLRKENDVWQVEARAAWAMTW